MGSMVLLVDGLTASQLTPACFDHFPVINITCGELRHIIACDVHLYLCTIVNHKYRLSPIIATRCWLAQFQIVANVVRDDRFFLIRFATTGITHHATAIIDNVVTRTNHQTRQIGIGGWTGITRPVVGIAVLVKRDSSTLGWTDKETIWMVCKPLGYDTLSNDYILKPWITDKH